MLRSIPLAVAFIVFCFISLTGCATVPALDGPASVPVSAVVGRLKCDLQREVWQRASDPSGKYEFLKHWAGKIHLTLVVDDTAGVNPGATVIQPLVNAQTFSLGVGGGLTTEAVRQADLEFLLSFDEINKEFANPANRQKYGNCSYTNGYLLESDLRLNEVFDAALAPVRDGLLTYGSHPGPAGSTVPQISPAEAKSLSKTVEIFTTKSADVQVQYSGDTNPFDTKKAHVASEIKNLEGQSKEIVDNIVKPLSDLAVNIDPVCAAAISEAKDEAVVSSALVYAGSFDLSSAKTLPQLDAALAKVDRASQKVSASAKTIIRKLTYCSAASERAGKPKVLYDPIDLISQTVNFYITSTGSVTPIWKLVRVSAPLAPTFVSATRKDTNTLILSFGRPDTKADGAPKASDAMSAQVLSSLLTQAVQSAPAFRQ